MTETRTAIAGIEKALDVLLTEVIAHRRKQPPADVELVVWDAGDDPGPIPNRDHSMMLRIIEDPIEGAYLLAIHRLGEQLFREGGVDLMSDVLERVKGRSRWDWAIILHQCWAGIGDGATGRAWAA